MVSNDISDGTTDDIYFEKIILNPLLNKIIKLLFSDLEIELYLDKNKYSQRQLSTQHKLSRFKIKRIMKKTSKKIAGLKHILINLN